MASYERITLDTVDLCDVDSNIYNDSDNILHPQAAFRRQWSSFGLSTDKYVVFHQPSPVASSEGQTSKEERLGISYVPGSPERIKRAPVGLKETLNSTYSTPEVPSGRTNQAAAMVSSAQRTGTYWILGLGGWDSV
jgi:hypothetical protein